MSVDAVLDDAFTTLLAKVMRPQQQQQQQTRPIRVCDVAFTLGAIGSPLLGGEHVFFRLGLNGPATILTWSMAGTINGIPALGSVTVDLLAGLTLATAGSICGISRPALVAQPELNDQVPVGWTTSLFDPSSVMARVVAVDGLLEQVGLTLRVAVDTDPLVSVVTDSSGEVVTDSTGAPVTWG